MYTPPPRKYAGVKIVNSTTAKIINPKKYRKLSIIHWRSIRFEVYLQLTMLS